MPPATIGIEEFDRLIDHGNFGGTRFLPRNVYQLLARRSEQKLDVILERSHFHNP